MESTEIISPPSFSASASTTSDLPTAVGPASRISRESRIGRPVRGIFVPWPILELQLGGGGATRTKRLRLPEYQYLLVAPVPPSQQDQSRVPDWASREGHFRALAYFGIASRWRWSNQNKTTPVARIPILTSCAGVAQPPRKC